MSQDQMKGHHFNGNSIKMIFFKINIIVLINGRRYRKKNAFEAQVYCNHFHYRLGLVLLLDESSTFFIHTIPSPDVEIMFSIQWRHACLPFTPANTSCQYAMRSCRDVYRMMHVSRPIYRSFFYLLIFFCTFSIRNTSCLENLKKYIR